MSKIIAVDFDGTCASIAKDKPFPAIGDEVPNCIKVLKECITSGNKIILYTIRDGKDLTIAIEWLASRGIKLWGINNNPSQKSWSQSRKVYADLYIDDLSLGVPLREDLKISKRPFVDWMKVKKILNEKGFL